MSYCAGDLREHCTLQTVTRTQDAAGNTGETWTDSATLACAVSSVSSKDFYAAAAANCADVVTFTVRYISGIDCLNNRVSYNGVVYGIIEINLLGAKRDFMQLKTRASKGTGVRT